MNSRVVGCVGVIVTFGRLCVGSVVNSTYDSLHRLTRVDYANGASIAYTYDAAGNRLSLVSQAPGSIRNISLGGNLGFGNVEVGLSAQRTLIITNSGNATLTVSGITYPNGFTGNWAGEIPSGGSQSVPVTFTPPAVSSYSGNLTVNCNYTGGTNTMTISGAGTPVSEARFQDDFNDNSIDVSKWTNWGSAVSESGQIMQVLQSVTDAGGNLMTRPISISTDGIIRVTRNVKLHYSMNYFIADTRLNFGSLPAVFIKYANMDYDSPPERAVHGFYICRNGANPHDTSYNPSDVVGPITPVWDTWFKETIAYTPQSGDLAYFIDDVLKATFNVGVMPVTSAPTLTIRFNAWGWWTGYEHLFDNLLVTQSGGATPTLFVTPGNQPVSSARGTTLFMVVNAGGGTMSYAANESESWLSIAGGGSGGNSGTITVSYDANSGTISRTGTITVTASGAADSPRNVTVVQAGAGAGMSPSGGQAIENKRPAFTWPATAGATWYQLWINRNGLTYLKQWVSGAASWTPPGDLPSGTYRWWCQPWGPSIGYGAWSTAADFSIVALVPGILAQIAPQGQQSGNDLAYRWQKDPRATYYHLWVQRTGAGTWHDRWYPMSGTGEASVTVAGHPGGDFTWRVQGWSSDGTGPWAGPVAFSTPSADPVKPVLTAPSGGIGNNRPTFQWNVASRATWYRLYVQRGSTKVSDQWTQSTSQLSPVLLSTGGHSWWIGAWNDVTRKTIWSDRMDFWVP